MATLTFLTGGYNTVINSLNGSGLGFFGAGGFGNSVAVGAYQDTTYITDGNGVSLGPQGNNVKYIAVNSGQLAGSVNLALQSIPNYQSTLNIRFNNATAVKTQNGKLYIYDRVSTNNGPSGVVCAAATVIHPTTTQVTGGSGSVNWEFPVGSSYLNLSQTYNGLLFSPGTSGNGINGGATIDNQHDFYVNLSASPSTVGSKTQFGLFVSLEYL